MNANRRITLVARPSSKPSHDWNHERTRSGQVAFVESFRALRFAFGPALEDVGLDVERVILDRCGDCGDFLEFLTEMPAAFAGDIVFLREDGSGFLSATGRGGDRLLYSMREQDVRFYLEAHDLVTGRASLALTA
jgi:hypothetical protein